MPKMNQQERAEFRRRLRQQDERFGPLTEPTEREFLAAEEENKGSESNRYLAVIRRAIDAQIEGVIQEGRKAG
jgi:hypothetical protein